MNGDNSRMRDEFGGEQHNILNECDLGGKKIIGWHKQMSGIGPFGRPQMNENGDSWVWD